MRDVDLDIAPGERVLLLGASGAGKSTLLAGMAGLLGSEEDGAASGSLLIDGEDPAAHRGRVGLVLQDPDAGVVLSRVGDDVAFGCENLGVDPAEIPARVAEALDAVGLEVPVERETARLSGGQKQRLAIAGVLAMRPGLLLLDEPTANLDPEGVEEVRQAVGEAALSSGATLVVIEHRTDVWRDLMTRVIVLDAAGGLLADGTPAEVFERHADVLLAAGVWLPGRPVDLPALPAAPSGADSALRARELAISRDGRTAVREGLDLEIAAGAAFVLTGPNGAGKSTLALTLAGLLPEYAGSVEAALVPAGRRGSRPSRWTSRELLTRIGTVFQDPEHQFLTQTVRDELAVGPRALKMTDAATSRVVDDLLERLGLAMLARANPFTLSGGQKRRLSVATVLATSPQVIVLDEPTFGQDRHGWAGIVGLLQEQIGEGRSVVAVTHDDEVVRLLGGRRWALAGVAP
ncbi:ATP-binding cassette domain-containing protein [Microbacterium sp. LX3-4]|uniref:ATP-binding cassette domain-containing protein n=1 Tax=Microbacterium dauci TaxID=3048008 RepID=A0ABT6ZEC1_9MICO|nr:ABC transporter ATP-binding protein [Microbacterium sp. LX3-4]MDJ1114331.1 ATP-binding cassette domain-containing protein [Microbacterium sp. LX3-4]